MAIFAHVMKSSSILLSDHVRLTYEVCTYPGPLDNNVILKYTVSVHARLPYTPCVHQHVYTIYMWDSVCTNTLNKAHKCIVYYVSVYCVMMLHS